MNNPVMMLLNTMRNGGNPNALLMQMAKNNPQISQLLNMMQGKSPQQLQQMAHNVARERGTTVEEVARSLGIQIPSNR